MPDQDHRLTPKARKMLAEHAKEHLGPRANAARLRARKHGPKKAPPHHLPPPRLHSGKKGIVDWQYAMMPHAIEGAATAALAEDVD